MRILCLDTQSNALDFLMRAQMYGHEVLYWNARRKDGTERRAGEHIVPIITEFRDIQRKWLDWADLIYLPDNIEYLDMLEPYRVRGYPIFGPSVEAAQLELDRGEGQKAMKAAGIPIIESIEFHDYDAAISYVKKHSDQVFVSKPSGEADKALSYVSNSAADLVYMLKRWKTVPKYVQAARKDGFILQEKKLGAEMAVGGWFGLGGWSKWWSENFEYKKLMDGDLGVNTGEQGTLVRLVKQSKLADLALKPMTKALKKLGYVGHIDNNVIIDERGNIWPMEFTMRDGWPLKHNHISLQHGDPAKWMLDLLNGEDTLQATDGLVSISVVVSIPDYPYSRFTQKDTTGIPIYGASDMEHVHLSEVMLADDVPVQVGGKVVEMPNYVTAGDYVCVVTGTGDTITTARRSAYAAVQKIKIPNSPSWRLDIGRSKLVENLPKIQAHGFAKGLSY